MPVHAFTWKVAAQLLASSVMLGLFAAPALAQTGEGETGAMSKPPRPIIPRAVMRGTDATMVRKIPVRCGAVNGDAPTADVICSNLALATSEPGAAFSSPPAGLLLVVTSVVATSTVAGTRYPFVISTPHPGGPGAGARILLRFEASGQGSHVFASQTPLFVVRPGEVMQRQLSDVSARGRVDFWGYLIRPEDLGL